MACLTQVGGSSKKHETKRGQRMVFVERFLGLAIKAPKVCGLHTLSLWCFFGVLCVCVLPHMAYGCGSASDAAGGSQSGWRRRALKRKPGNAEEEPAAQKSKEDEMEKEKAFGTLSEDDLKDPEKRKKRTAELNDFVAQFASKEPKQRQEACQKSGENKQEDALVDSKRLFGWSNLQNPHTAQTKLYLDLVSRIQKIVDSCRALRKKEVHKKRGAAKKVGVAAAGAVAGLIAKIGIEEVVTSGGGL